MRDLAQPVPSLNIHRDQWGEYIGLSRKAVFVTGTKCKISRASDRLASGKRTRSRNTGIQELASFDLGNQAS